MRRIITQPQEEMRQPSIKQKLGSLSFPNRVVIGNRKELEKLVVADKKVKQTLDENQDLFEPVYKQNKWSHKKHIFVCILEGLSGFAITVFGVINAGSYFADATRFGGTLFQWMYIYQFGTVFEIWGLIIIYDAIKKIVKP